MRKQLTILCIAVILIAALMPVVAMLAAPLVAIALLAPVGATVCTPRATGSIAPTALVALTRTGHLARAALSA